jgi:hypothetical protein
MAHGKSSYEQGAAETYIAVAGMLRAWAFFFIFAASVSGILSAVPNIYSMLSWNSIIWRSKCSARYSRMCRCVVSLFRISLVSSDKIIVIISV